ncbi:unnamed protein product [Paramecium sonneborni]|uniref:Uncharacterized protein n=1 Tax=Paramecium sonneborni TaxID=65129 RepID=A0A8S1RR39_9CILI|nr:unnamed protein product [Paramecium sonneborni]
MQEFIKGCLTMVRLSRSIVKFVLKFLYFKKYFKQYKIKKIGIQQFSFYSNKNNLIWTINRLKKLLDFDQCLARIIQDFSQIINHNQQISKLQKNCFQYGLSNCGTTKLIKNHLLLTNWKKFVIHLFRVKPKIIINHHKVKPINIFFIKQSLKAHNKEDAEIQREHHLFGERQRYKTNQMERIKSIIRSKTKYTIE